MKKIENCIVVLALCFVADWAMAQSFIVDGGESVDLLCDSFEESEDGRYVGGKMSCADEANDGESWYRLSYGGNKAVYRAKKSVLSEGKWAKVRVKKSGMKLLTNSALKQMGFDNPKKIAVYGNGGVQLPFDNSKSRVDDLAKQPVVVTENGVLFYAEGPLTWTYNQTYSRFVGANHSSSEYSYYFITDSGEPSAEPRKHVAEEAMNYVTTYSSRFHYEENVNNLLSSGRDWFGVKMTPSNNSMDIDLGLPERVSDSPNVKVTMRLAGRSGSELSYKLSLNGSVVGNGTIASSNVSGSTTSDYARVVTRNLSVKSGDLSKSKLTLTVAFNSATDMAWLDYVSATSEAVLDMNKADEFGFREVSTYSKKGASEYRVKNVKKGVRVWNVFDCSNIEEMDVKIAGDSMVMAHNNGVKTDFIAFNPDYNFDAPEYVGMVENQNLHGVERAQYLIITHEDFAEQARRLAELHRDNQGLNVVVAECEQIYNEFSSGKRDVSAIRDYIKMVYDRDGSWETGLRYVLLFGDGSYDNMTLGSKNEGNKIPTYQSANSVHQSNTYVTDDFFGWLDSSDGASDTGSRMDVGVGRFPCRTAEEAKALVDKSELYLTSLDPGKWKTKVTVVADDGDKNEHLNYAEKIAELIEEQQPGLSLKRIFLESYAATTTSTGVFYEGARNDFTDAINNGSLFIDYVGHAGYNGLTDDGLFKQKDIVKWTNARRLPMFITAACDFAPFDLPNTSSGEESLMYSGGGFIGVFASTRVVFSDSNHSINKALVERLTSEDENGDYYSMGEASRYAKVAAGGLINSMKYVLVGDPAISLCNNHQSVVTDSVNGVASDGEIDAFSALGLSRLSGSVRDEDGEIDDTFNGTINVTLYDKKSVTKTTGIKSSVYSYDEYKTVLFSGVADVEDGRFTVEFKLSKDINFELGYGKIVYYATSSDNREADGVDYNVLVGGASSDMKADTVGPVIRAWIDYEQSGANGYRTGTSPTLYAYIEDPSGINTSGLGVGHDLALYYDGDRNNSVSLNGYFTYDAGSYSKGLLVYHMNDLPEGDLGLTLKAWDNMNNSSQETLDIKVVKDCPISFGEVKLCPNPLTEANGQMKLQFSHNDGGVSLDMNIAVYSMNGQLLSKKKVSVASSSMQTETLVLTDEMPEIACLPRGFYVLNVEVSDKNGRKGDFVKKFSVIAK